MAVTGSYLHCRPNQFFLISRATIIFFGMGVILLVFWIGKNLFSNRVGILSALFMAFSFPYVSQSVWTKADMPALFFLLIGFLFSIKILSNREKQNDIWLAYVLTGFFIGLATSAKINAIFGLVFLIVAHATT